MPPNNARFLQGSTFRHVVVMALTGSVGLMFLFLVDVATLFWVSQIGVEKLVAALGFVWAVQFFTVSVSIGLGIAATARVSRALGSGNADGAGEEASSSMLIAAALLAGVAVLVITFRHSILDAIGAETGAREFAAHFLLLTVPALPLIGIAVTAASVLRAAGQAIAAASVTFCAGLVAVVLDPLFIFGFGLGIDGAAYVVVLSRLAACSFGLYMLVHRYKLAGPPSPVRAWRAAPAIFAIAGPAIIAQSTGPIANAFITFAVSAFGDAAVAGWSVVSRLTFVAFGGLFALSTAIGGIFGQNYGAGALHRVRSTYRDALIYCGCYVAVVWIILILAHQGIAAAFNLSPAGAELLTAFAWIGAGATVFYGALAVANAAFNTLDRPLWATALNWLRDVVVLVPLVVAATASMGAVGAIYGQAGAMVSVGIAAAYLGWRFVNELRPLAGPAPNPTS